VVLRTHGRLADTAREPSGGRVDGQHNSVHAGEVGTERRDQEIVAGKRRARDGFARRQRIDSDVEALALEAIEQRAGNHAGDPSRSRERRNP
jgi:hypothetical protein